MDATRPRQRRVWDLAADPRVADAALVAVCLLLTALAAKTPWSPLPLPVIVVAGALGSVALWPRRRWPVLAAMAGAVAFALSGNPGPWLVGLYTGAVYSRRRWVAVCAVAGWAGYTAQSWVDERAAPWDDAAAGLLATGLVVVVGRYVATRNQLLAWLRERSERIETERLLRDEQARSAERDRIAREMHDVLAHKVSLIALYAGALELHAGVNPRLREGAAMIRATAREALQELRHVLGLLHGGEDPARPAGEPFNDLTTLVQASRLAGQRVELNDEAGRLPPATGRVVYRVVQEGLTNAHKHAPDAPITVVVRRNDDRSVTVEMFNDIGASAPMDLPGSGSGLVGLAERIRLIGGTLQSGPFEHDGRARWRLCAVVPRVGQAP